MRTMARGLDFHDKYISNSNTNIIVMSTKHQNAKRKLKLQTLGLEV